MSHLSDRLRLAAEPRDRVWVGRNPMHHLDCTGACEGDVVGAIDDAHRALAYEVLDLILTQSCARFDRHER